MGRAERRRGGPSAEGERASRRCSAGSSRSARATPGQPAPPVRGRSYSQDDHTAISGGTAADGASIKHRAVCADKRKVRASRPQREAKGAVAVGIAEFDALIIVAD